MLAKKPVAVNGKLVSAKKFWTSLYYMKFAVCVIFHAPQNLYIINKVNQIELWPKCLHSLFSQHFMWNVLVYVHLEASGEI